MLQILNKQESTTNFALKTHTKTFKTLAKPISRSNVFFLILPWSCPVVNNSLLNLDLHFRRWTTAMVKVRRATMFPNPKEKQKKTYADMYRPHRHCKRIAGWIHRTFFLETTKSPTYSETPTFSSTNHIVQKFLVEWRSRICYICIYVYMYICICICVYMYICIYVYVYICIYVNMLSTYICIYVNLYICKYVYMYICICIYIYM